MVYTSVEHQNGQYKWKILWKMVFRMGYIHLGGFIGLYLFLSRQLKWQTIIFHTIYMFMTQIGIACGVHRLWSHRCYKAKLPLRILLATMHSMGAQGSIYDWVRNHRVHHKFVDTDADPHNINRGFFFSHVGWTLIKKHAEVKQKGSLIDFSDLEQDSVVVFQRKFYGILTLIFAIIIPWYIPVYFGENPWHSWYAGVMRMMLHLNFTFCVNSVCHLWGYRPYDKNIAPADNKWVSCLVGGEGWHNYHHTFPWDYKASELMPYKYNVNTAVIDFFAWIGWAYDLKTVSDKVVKERMEKNGETR